MPLPLETQRLTLRSPSVEDAKALLEVFGDPDAMRYVGDGRTRTVDELCLALERGISLEAERGFNMFVVVRRDDGRVLATVAFPYGNPQGKPRSGGGSRRSTGAAGTPTRQRRRCSGSLLKKSASPGSSASFIPRTRHRRDSRDGLVRSRTRGGG